MKKYFAYLIVGLFCTVQLGSAVSAYAAGTCHAMTADKEQDCTSSPNTCQQTPSCYWVTCEANDPADQATCAGRTDNVSCTLYDQKNLCQPLCETGDGKCTFKQVQGKAPAAQAPATGGTAAAQGTKDPCVETVTEPCDPVHPEQGLCVKLCNPLQGNVTDVRVIIGIIIRGALGIIGSITLVMLVWGGFKWLTAAGNPERVQEGTKTMIWAAIGVFIVFSSYFILINFTQYLTGAK